MYLITKQNGPILTLFKINIGLTRETNRIQRKTDRVYNTHIVFLLKMNIITELRALIFKHDNVHTIYA